MKAISILAWFKQTLLSRSDGFAYQYMALGLSPNLKLDELPSSFSATGNEFDQNHIHRIKAFWSLFLIERTSTPGLGLPKAIPWDYNHAPLSACLSLSLDDCPSLYFKHHCQLLQLRHLFIETCYMPGFGSLEVEDQKAQLRRASEALIAFRQPTNECTHVNTSTRCSTLRTVLWISYHAAIIDLYRPFLDRSWASQVDSMMTPLEALTTASDSIAGLLGRLGTGTEVQNMPPFVIYHILRAALVQCLNMTVVDESMKRTARERFQVCLAALTRMKENWKVPGEACINFLIYVGQSWKITPW
uniref:Transcription factor domain-containing protein n=1 Tax=Bionectria ochroleuca TaxID=29856 RepID=A0A0B7K377_BIOOC